MRALTKQSGGKPKLASATEIMFYKTHLVTIAPREVLGADVLVGVLDALLKRRKVVPVLPVFIPEVVRVDTGKDQGRNNSAVDC